MTPRSRIRLLPETTVNRIAAGEVIERPAAAVKELVENALDAGAHRIAVVLAGGGIDRIEVTDDGAGMTAEELALCVLRHATSKLADDDLIRVATLGFRGEALPSIGAAARLEITSRPRDADRPAVGHGLVGHGPVGHGLVGHGLVGHGLVGHGLVGHGLVGHGPVGHAPVGHAPVGHGPVGHAPVGHAPVGHAPVGHAPVGHAWSITVEGGAVGQVVPAAGTPGTRIVVRDLFFATPARRKFLKNPRTEAEHAEAVVRRLAMAAPATAFRLENEGRVIFDLPAQDRAPRVAALLGPEAAAAMLPVYETRGAGHRRGPESEPTAQTHGETCGETGETIGAPGSDPGRGSPAEMVLSGYMCAPAISRMTAAAQGLVVNGRPVADPVLKTAVRVAYRDVIAHGRHPVVALWLDLPPEDLDVNVHPAKTEVRFRDPAAVRSLVIGALGRVLAGAAGTDMPGPGLLRHRPSWHRSGTHPEAPPGTRDGIAALPPPGFPLRPPGVSEPVSLPGHGPNQDEPLGQEPGPFGSGLGQHGSPRHGAGPYGTASHGAPPNGAPPNDTTRRGRSAEVPVWNGASPPGALDFSAAPAARTVPRPDPGHEFPLGAAVAQVLDTYIIAVAADGTLILVDQHAAHERLTHEAIRSRMLDGAASSQPLLLPAVVDLPEADASRLLARAEDLARLGLEIEAFGHGAVLVRALPAALGAPEPAPLIRDIADELAELDETMALSARLEAVIARMACHGSIRAGRRLGQAEMDALLRQMEATPRAATCSHGRPTFLRLSKAEIETLFGRR